MANVLPDIGAWQKALWMGAWCALAAGFVFGLIFGLIIGARYL